MAQATDTNQGLIKKESKPKPIVSIKNQHDTEKGLMTDEPHGHDHEWVIDDGHIMPSNYYPSLSTGIYGAYPVYDNKKCSILVLGITGSGKSSLCCLLSGQDVPTSSGSESCTDKTKAYKSKYNENMEFIDTMGTQDSQRNDSGSKRKYNDPQILKQALRYLHSNNINISKVIWCIDSGEKDRKGPFLDQAHFISGLKISTNDDEEGKENDTSSIWQSVLIIKNGNEDIRGVIAAANHYHANYKEEDVDKYVFGFKCIKWIKEKEESDPETKKDPVLSFPEQFQKQMGYISEEEAKKIIMRKLDNLKFFTFKFLAEKCTKCGITGDSRYMIAPCHTKKESYHSSSISLRHGGKKKYYHSGDKVDFVAVEYIHTGYKSKQHVSNTIIQHHLGPNYKKVARIKQIAYKIYNVFEPFYTEKDWAYWECCNQYESESLGCTWTWKCCGQNENVKECTNPEAIEIWSCCPIYNTSGVMHQMPCKEINYKLEKFMYECCNRVNEGNGCKMKYDCCDLFGEGCQEYYPCCNQSVDSPGCQKKCVNCKIPWGTGIIDEKGINKGGCMNVMD